MDLLHVRGAAAQVRPTSFRFEPVRRSVLFGGDRFGTIPRLVLLVLTATLLASFAPAQQPAAVERTYKYPQAAVERALRDLQAYTTASLPVLDGFVTGDSNTFDSYDNPQYEFRIKLTASAPDQTIVAVSARVTAWYSDAVSSQSRYALLPSNGRLEKELLDRLAGSLARGSAAQPANSIPKPTTTPSAPVPAMPSSPVNTIALSPIHSGNIATIQPANSAAPARESKAASAGTPSAEATDIAKVRAERETLEQENRKLQQQISQLEADRGARKYLPDLAMVKSVEAPVYAQANVLSRILFRADPEDEFEVSDAHAGWVHIRLENGGQGWIMMNELQLPNEKDDTGDSADFVEPNEEVAPFTGDWAQLKDKPTLFVVAQPRHAIPAQSLGQSQIDFAKRAFLDAYRAAAHSQEKIDGVAVVFLGDKSGMAAATLNEIGRWHKGVDSDKIFLNRCFLSPPEAFRDIAKQ